ncbi:TetR/AcrR family transcriptional regulator [Agrobacterium larrymoorei]|uniref:TetR/AcrR family transcriptional regulator n=1 Tax=Agrobacterium larrymoorei TaxID=160699 RepID=UPI001574963A|nr:TetR/AcrR family transcriptional regulator [Agrobacterium larrymoorei]NTJ44097.1 TetR/AcrR family transcriptional regulator [Agrobacterium larrymoorei]
MGRPRKITNDDILDAAERVVARLGATGLSIDAVAKEVGVSKAMVVYDHKSKSALLEALVDRRVKADMAYIAECVSAAADTPHPELFGRIASAEKKIDEIDKAVAVTLSASMSNDDRLQRFMRDWTDLDLNAMASGERPQAALMAYLALMGFYSTELFGFHSWPDKERQDILRGIRAIYLSFADS